MKAEPILPNEDLVRNACRQFDQDHAVTERALLELFSRYPLNDDHVHVFLKVVALNRLYSTNIFAVHDMAKHIYEHANEIDLALAAGSPEVVDKIAKITVSATGRHRTNYSFASKYCSWHDQASYPIWDSRVDRYLRSLTRTDFGKYLPANLNLCCHYRDFVELMVAFREYCHLSTFTFKEIDKFLWFYGDLPTAAEAPQD